MKNICSSKFGAALGLGFAAAGGFISACSGASVIGALSNFDINNDTGQPCDEFELIISNCAPAQLYGTWNYNPDYGPPQVTDLGGDARVHYVAHTNITTAPGTIEHFGAILSAFPTNGVTYSWMRNGTNVGAIGSFPAPVQFPAPVVTIVPIAPSPALPEGGHGRHREVRNTDRTNTFWVQRTVLRTNREVRLDDLMVTNNLIVATTNLEDHPKRLRPGDRLSDDDTVPENESEGQVNDVMSLQVFADDNGKPGRSLGTFMSAAITLTRARGESVHREQDGRNTVNFTVEPDTNYVVQVSDDAIHWTDTGVIQTNRSTGQFHDDSATNAPSRYYRLRQQ